MSATRQMIHSVFQKLPSKQKKALADKMQAIEMSIDAIFTPFERSIFFAEDEFGCFSVAMTNPRYFDIQTKILALGEMLDNPDVLRGAMAVMNDNNDVYGLVGGIEGKISSDVRAIIKNDERRGPLLVFLATTFFAALHRIMKTHGSAVHFVDLFTIMEMRVRVAVSAQSSSTITFDKWVQKISFNGSESLLKLLETAPIEELMKWMMDSPTQPTFIHNIAQMPTYGCGAYYPQVPGVGTTVQTTAVHHQDVFPSPDRSTCASCRASCAPMCPTD